MNNRALEAVNCLLYLCNAVMWGVVAHKPFLALAWLGVAIMFAYRVTRPQ